MRKLAGMLIFSIALGVAQVARANPMDDALDADIRHDFAAELAIIRPLAEGGDAWAQYNLAGMYDDGRGVAQDRKEALKWYRLAAARRFARAQLALGAIYESEWPSRRTMFAPTCGTASPRYRSVSKAMLTTRPWRGTSAKASPRA